MGVPDTLTGGKDESFPETIWSTVLTHGRTDSAQYRQALSRLLEGYWRPVYKYIRVTWGKSIEDAKDLTQSFFIHLLEEGVVARYQSAKGRFRHFLKGTLKNFLAETHRGSLAQKRGGSRVVVSLNVEGLETDDLQDAGQSTPDEVFDRQWASDVLARGISQLRKVLHSEGKMQCWNVYEAYELNSEGPNAPTYSSVAQALRLTEHQVKNYLDYARATLQRLVVREVSDVVASPEDLREELNDLFPESRHGR